MQLHFDKAHRELKMEFFHSLTWLILSFPIALFLWSKLRSPASKLRPPPGPPGWPLIGNIFDVGAEPHVNFHKLQSKYGPLLWLKLGNLNTLVIQSTAAVAELYKNHDLDFADRNVPDALTAGDFDKGSLSTAPYGDYWRTLRRLSSNELLVHKRFDASKPLRQKCIDTMIQQIKDDAAEIQLYNYLLMMSFNLLSNFMLSKDIMELKSETVHEFTEAMEKFLSCVGRPNVVDFFGFLKWLDPQGIRRNSERHLQELMKLVSGFVKERIQEKKKQRRETETRDFLDALLEYDGEGKRGAPDSISEKNVALNILEIFIAGTDSTSNTIQWGMAELLGHPESMMKLKAEIDGVVGPSRKVEEGDISELPYLQAVVKETLRLHPPAPLLIPRKARQDTEFMGYHIPKNTQVLVNVWSIHRDPGAWENPFSFKPERFLNSNIDYMGRHYELIPFGSGRRSCVGLLMAERMFSLTLARLIQSFDWELPLNVSPDMREKMVVTLSMLVPLKLVPKERKI